MYKNIIAIDPSLTSTGIVVNGKIISFVKDANAWNAKRTKLKKWFALCENHVEFGFITYTDKTGYSETEVNKLISYRSVAHNIITEIKKHLIEGPTIVAIEGYSYQSVAGPLIDLVTFSTHLRSLLEQLSDELVILAPATLKLESAKLTYPGVDVGKRVIKMEWRNREGVAGGSLTKHDMYKALIENDDINDDWNSLLCEHAGDILSAKSVPKPIEDINDAKLMYEIIKHKINNDISLDFIK